MKKNKKISFISISIVTILLVVGYFLFYKNNFSFINSSTEVKSGVIGKEIIKENNFDSSAENIAKFININDNNTWFLMRNFLSKNIDFGNTQETEEEKYNSAGLSVMYYDADVFVGRIGFYNGKYNLYSVKDGSKLNTKCYISSSEGYFQKNDILLSAYHADEIANSSEGYGLCLYEAKSKDFVYLDLWSKLKSGESFIKSEEMFGSLYEYKINEENRIISIFVFDKDKKYIRSVEVKY